MRSIVKEVCVIKYYIDTEFIDTGRTIDLISIGIVAEDGRELYLQSTEFEPEKAAPWVQDHVLNTLLVCPHLSGNVRGLYAHEGGQCAFEDPAKHIVGAYADCLWRTRTQIRDEVQHFINNQGGKPELWGWCSAYDYVALCQIFGTMMDIPQDWPHYIRDIQQTLDERGISDDILPQQRGQAHNALEDARHIQALWKFLFEDKPRGAIRPEHAFETLASDSKPLD